MRPCTWNSGMTSSDRSSGVSSYVATMLEIDAARFPCESGTPCAHHRALRSPEPEVLCFCNSCNEAGWCNAAISIAARAPPWACWSCRLCAETGPHRAVELGQATCRAQLKSVPSSTSPAIPRRDGRLQQSAGPIPSISVSEGAT